MSVVSSVPRNPNTESRTPTSYHAAMARTLIPIAVLAAVVAAGLGLWQWSPWSVAVISPPVVEDAGQLDPLIGRLLQERVAMVRNAPRDVDAWLQLAFAYHAHYLIDEAAPCYRQVIAFEPSHAGAWFHLARIAARRGDHEGAIDLLDRSIAHEASYGPAQWQRGFWLLQLGRLDEAEPSFQRAIELDASDPAGLLGQGRVLVESGRYEEAATLLERVLVTHPRENYTNQLLAAAYRGVGRIADAAAVAARSDGSQRDFPDPWSSEVARHRTGYAAITQRAKALLEVRKPADALSVLEPLRSTHDDDPRVLNLLSSAYASLGRVDDSLAALKRSAEIDPENYVTHFNLSFRYEQTRDIQAALHHVDRAIEIDPKRPDALSHKAKLLIIVQELDEAIAVTRAAIAAGDTSLQNRITLGQLLDRTGQARQAGVIFQELTAEYPNEPNAHIGLALASASMGDFEVAWASWERARVLKPGDPFLKFAGERIGRMERGEE